jgi:hypothetical protein
MLIINSLGNESVAILFISQGTGVIYILEKAQKGLLKT